MRIIGQIEHPVLKITIFRMDQRISVKFENERYEQTYKLGTDERFATVEGVQQWADAAMIEQVQLVFQQMHLLNLNAIERAYPTPELATQFEEII